MSNYQRLSQAKIKDRECKQMHPGKKFRRPPHPSIVKGSNNLKISQPVCPSAEIWRMAKVCLIKEGQTIRSETWPGSPLSAKLAVCQSEHISHNDGTKLVRIKLRRPLYPSLLKPMDQSYFNCSAHSQAYANTHPWANTQIHTHNQSRSEVDFILTVLTFHPVHAQKEKNYLKKPTASGKERTIQVMENKNI